MNIGNQILLKWVLILHNKYTNIEISFYQTYGRQMKKLVTLGAPFPRKLSNNCWILGNYYFNLFLLKGENASILVELGISGIVDSVIEQLDLLQISSDYLVMTHPHSDHLEPAGLVVQKFARNVNAVAG